MFRRIHVADLRAVICFDFKAFLRQQFYEPLGSVMVFQLYRINYFLLNILYPSQLYGILPFSRASNSFDKKHFAEMGIKFGHIPHL